VRTFGFGPLTGTGQITLGLYVGAKGREREALHRLDGARGGQRRASASIRQNSQRASNRPARRRHVMGITRALDHGQQGGRFQGLRISLAVRGA
jgi:hypothetical protein